MEQEPDWFEVFTDEILDLFDPDVLSDDDDDIGDGGDDAADDEPG